MIILPWGLTLWASPPSCSWNAGAPPPIPPHPTPPAFPPSSWPHLSPFPLPAMSLSSFLPSHLLLPPVLSLKGCTPGPAPNWARLVSDWLEYWPPWLRQHPPLPKLLGHSVFLPCSLCFLGLRHQHSQVSPSAPRVLLFLHTCPQ